MRSDRRGVWSLARVLALLLLLGGATARVAGLQSLALPVGSSRIVTGVDIKQVAVSDPTIVDVQPVTSTEVLLVAKAQGATEVFIWDKCGRRELRVSVSAIRPGVQAFAKSIQAAIAAPDVKVEAAGDKVLLKGQVTSQEELRRIDTVAKAIYPKVENVVTVVPRVTPQTLQAINSAIARWSLKAEATPDGKVVVTGKVRNSAVLSEVSQALKAWEKNTEFVMNVSLEKTAAQDAAESLTAALSKWGVKATALPDGRVLVEGSVRDKDAMAAVDAVLRGWPKGVDIVSQVSLVDVTKAQQVLIRARVVELTRQDLKDLGVDWCRIVYSQSTGSSLTYSAEDQPFIIGQTQGPFTLFGGSPIEQLDPIGARVNALLRTDRAVLLSQPSLVTTSGMPANILVGGEIPIPVPQSGTGGFATITIEYKLYGIQLTVVPIVGDDCEISMLVKPEVSALDYTNGIEISGIIVPGLRTRRAESTVHVPSGCSIVIGGMLSSDDIRDVKAIPLLSKIPVLGNFFKNVSTQKRDTELVIVVTPELVRTTTPEMMVLDTKVGLPAWDPFYTGPTPECGDNYPSSPCPTP